jgi:hypothetical protein
VAFDDDDDDQQDFRLLPKIQASAKSKGSRNGASAQDVASELSSSSTLLVQKTPLIVPNATETAKSQDALVKRMSRGASPEKRDVQHLWNVPMDSYKHDDFMDCVRELRENYLKSGGADPSTLRAISGLERKAESLQASYKNASVMPPWMNSGFGGTLHPNSLLLI